MTDVTDPRDKVSCHFCGGSGWNPNIDENVPCPECAIAADAAPDEDALSMFVRESNRIEGITETTDAHVEAHRKFLDGAITIPALIELVSVLQPDARFRNSPGVPHVRVGDHVAPPSGPDIEGNLRSILAMRDPWEQHIAYETLHPFTDGNGRSGRAVWLHRHWHETGLDPWAVRRGFLHSFYYHTLSGVRLATPTPRESPLAELQRLGQEFDAAAPREPDDAIHVLREALEAAREYFDQRADAECDPSGPGYTGNEEMRLLVMIDAALASTGKTGGSKRQSRLSPRRAVSLVSSAPFGRTRLRP